MQITAVIGAGTMGPGMAAVLSRAGAKGTRVRLYDTSPEALDRAKTACGLASKALDRLDEAPDQKPHYTGVVTFETDLAIALDHATLVLETIPEDLALKQKVIAEIETHVADDAIIATNTSGIPVSQIAAALKHPERFAGMHWSNPPHLVPMIEVVPGENTSEQTTAAITDVIEAIGYRAITENEVPGFVENRILYAILRECLSLVERGVVSAEDMDTCVKWGIGYKLAVIGPMRLLDMAGLDIYSSVASYLNPDLSASTGVPEMITERTKAGRLGMKTLGGIYPYTAEQVAQRRAEIADGLIAVRKILMEH
jgi:3-hydroxybutyryl-CoA dehydrogenase/5-formyl-3-hydroxy-2-methylpyridine 4-carboxylate dehydrogenase